MCIAVEQQNGLLLQLMLSKGWSGNISSKAPPKHSRNLVEDNSTIQTQDKVTDKVKGLHGIKSRPLSFSTKLMIPISCVS